MVTDAQAVIEAPAHLRVYRRGNHFIIYNPTVPTWVHTNAVGAIAVKLLDGFRSVAEIAEICTNNGVSSDSIIDFFESASAAKLFKVEPPSDRWNSLDWHSRKVEAIYLHLTNKCNLSCSYCYRNSSPTIAIKHFGPEFTQFLEDCKPVLSKQPKITFSGGEPMIHPDFFYIADYCHLNNFRCELLTNGMFMTDDNAHLISRYFNYVKISLDGASEDTHSRTRGSDNFDIVLRSIQLLSHQADIDVEVQMTVNRDNIDECHRLMEIIPGSVKIKYTPAMPMGRGKLDAEAQISNSEFIGVHQSVDVLGGRGAQQLIKNSRTFGCYAGITNLSISDRGDVYPCHLFHKADFKLGNIFVDSIDEMFFSDKNFEFSKSMDVENNNQSCSACDFRYLCGGGCKANPLHAHGDYRKSDTYCTFIRANLLDGMFAEAPISNP